MRCPTKLGFFNIAPFPLTESFKTIIKRLIFKLNLSFPPETETQVGIKFLKIPKEHQKRSHLKSGAPHTFCRLPLWCRWPSVWSYSLWAPTVQSGGWKWLIVSQTATLDFQSMTRIDLLTDQCQGEMLIGLWSRVWLLIRKLFQITWPAFTYS